MTAAERSEGKQGGWQDSKVPPGRQRRQEKKLEKASALRSPLAKNEVQLKQIKREIRERVGEKERVRERNESEQRVKLSQLRLCQLHRLLEL